MDRFNNQIFFKVITFSLAISLLFPTAIKFTHVFSNHQHEICYGEPQTHLHSADVDCSFHMFKLSTPFTIPSLEFIFIPFQYSHQIYVDAYSFVSEYQRLHFSLRGPPQIDLI